MPGTLKSSRGVKPQITGQDLIVRIEKLEERMSRFEETQIEDSNQIAAIDAKLDLLIADRQHTDSVIDEFNVLKGKFGLISAISAVIFSTFIGGLAKALGWLD